jgi:hypothetical protein
VDAKQTALLVELHARIVAGDFGETDVHALLTLLREDAPQHGVLRELGDFVAHRRRNKGPIHQYMREVKRILDGLGTQNDLLRINVVFTEAEIAIAVDSAFAAHGLATLHPVRGRQVQLAILSMLQAIAMTERWEAIRRPRSLDNAREV